MKRRGKKILLLCVAACLLTQLVCGMNFGAVAQEANVANDRTPDVTGGTDPYKVMQLARESGAVSDNILDISRMATSGTGITMENVVSYDGQIREVRKFYNPTEENGSGVGIDQAIQVDAIPDGDYRGVYTLSGWSKAENVQRGFNTEYFSYCLMASVTYEDGTGKNFHTSFTMGTHDWEYREVSFNVEKPVRSMIVYVFLRSPAYGTAWFDGIQLVKGDVETTSTFQETPMQVLQTAPDQDTKVTLKTDDGLEMGLGDSIVTSLKVDGTELANNAYSGFLVRDVGAEMEDGVKLVETSDKFGVYAFAPASGSSPTNFNGTQSTLGLNIEANYKEEDDHIRVTGVITDATNAADGRAVQLSYALPITASGWKWGEDINTFREIVGDQPGASYKDLGFDGHPVEEWDGPQHSTYPMSVIYNEDLGIAIAPSIEFPSYSIMEYNSMTGQYVLTYQLGIVPEAPEAARFDFVIYRIDDPEYGFRSSLKKFTQIFPEYYEVREEEQGMWISNIRGLQDVMKDPQDFNFKFKQMDGFEHYEATFDIENGIKGLHYIEPGDWWISNLADKSEEGVWAAIRERAADPDKDDKVTRQAIASLFCANLDFFGNLSFNKSNAAWAPDGAQIHINANPNLPGEFNFYSLYMDESRKQVLFDVDYSYGFVFDGVYLDETSGWWLGNANFNKDHYKYTTVPLTYSPYYKAPMLHRASTTWEFLQKLYQEMGELGKTIYSNKTPDKYNFNFRFVDGMGTETGCYDGNGVYTPVAQNRLAYYRTFAYQKPYSILTQGNYDAMDTDGLIAYFQDCLLYAIFPSLCGNTGPSGGQYFTSTALLYERDREIWKQYMPALKACAEAGWEPVTNATSNREEFRIERYGEDAADGVYYVIQNRSDYTVRGTINIPLSQANTVEGYTVKEMIANTDIDIVNDQYLTTLQPNQSIVVQIINPQPEEPTDPSDDEPTTSTSRDVNDIPGMNPSLPDGDGTNPGTGSSQVGGMVALLLALSAAGVAGTALLRKKKGA